CAPRQARFEFRVAAFFTCPRQFGLGESGTSMRHLFALRSPPMSQSVSCPACSAALDLSPEQMGHWVTCPHCRFGFAAVADGPSADPSPSLEDLYQAPDRSKTIAFVMIGAG